ncbi:MAG: hypothetical protein J7L62_07125 [Candidatus Aminicenantes bacterium]|nr:hypothetical protein [Candidatus Aminicenantes bacterium]
MNSLRVAKLISLALMASELIYGAIVFIIHRGEQAGRIIHKFDPAIFRGFYFAAAGIVLFILVLKRTLFSSNSLIKLDREQIVQKFSTYFIILNAMAETIGIIGLIMYFVLGTFKHSLILIAVSLVATILVYPFDYAIKGYMAEIERKKQYSLE